jgi:hypothetical protein
LQYIGVATVDNLSFRCKTLIDDSPTLKKPEGFSVKGEAVISYRNPLIPPTAGKDLKFSGFPPG